MNSDLVELGWTEEQWNRIATTVSEEAQKARVAAQALPVVGPEDPSTVAIPPFALSARLQPPPLRPPPRRLTVNSEPSLDLTTISINVQLRSHEMADPELKAGLTMFRRAANYIARIEDALVMGGRAPHAPPPGLIGIPGVYRVTGEGNLSGLFLGPVPGGRIAPPYPPPAAPVIADGNDVVNQIIAAINELDRNGQLGPYACLLSHHLFALVCTPTDNLVMPRDRILPFLQGPLLRCSQIANGWGVVVSLSGSPIELDMASELSVSYLQTTLEPRFVFRLSERVALRIKEGRAIALIG
jgi:uncharacterized linocin/CFP29 family protein